MTKFTLCVGLNDKDSKQQEITTLDAYKIALRVCFKYTDGATITESKGFYKHIDGTITSEVTLVIDLLFIERLEVLKIIDELKNLLNQETIALQEYNIKSDLI